MPNKGALKDCREFYYSESIRQRLASLGLDSFESIWTYDAKWIEEPNYDRQGWSGVSRIELNGTAPTAPMGAYLKRQENHGYRSLGNPFRLRPTAWREYRSIVAIQAAAIAAPDVLYYGERFAGGKMQAILISREVPQSISLADYILQAGRRPDSEVNRIIQDAAILIARFHRHRFQHSALFGKHILVSGFQAGRPESPQTSKRPVPYLIDLEKTRMRPSRIGIAVKDLSQLYRTVKWTDMQWEMLLDHYTAAGRLTRLRSLIAWLIQLKAKRKIAQRRKALGRSPFSKP